MANVNVKAKAKARGNAESRAENKMRNVQQQKKLASGNRKETTSKLPPRPPAQGLHEGMDRFYFLLTIILRRRGIFLLSPLFSSAAKCMQMLYKGRKMVDFAHSKQDPASQSRL